MKPFGYAGCGFGRESVRKRAPLSKPQIARSRSMRARAKVNLIKTDHPRN
jgi:hypothetical protein